MSALGERRLTEHRFTVDVEEYFQVSAFESSVPRSSWDGFESRVVASVERLLVLLADNDAKATFFLLGWVADRHPQLVKVIAEAGHEIASHGWDHRRVTDQRPEEFRDSVRRSKDLLENLSGEGVMGFRAPSFSIVPGCEWALDILLEEGYLYDSSMFPVRRPGYGYPNGHRYTHQLERSEGHLLEVPPATLRLWGVNIPAAGGGYFRVLPYKLVRATLLAHERAEEPATFYVHPWEIDPDQPRLDVPWISRLRHYSGLEGTADRLARLLGEFRFTSIARSLQSREPNR